MPTADSDLSLSWRVRGWLGSFWELGRSAFSGWAPTRNQNATAFGPLGVVLALLGFILIAVSISMACTVFGPVLAQFREAEKNRKAARPQGAEPKSRSDRREQRRYVGVFPT